MHHTCALANHVQTLILLFLLFVHRCVLASLQLIVETSRHYSQLLPCITKESEKVPPAADPVRPAGP